MACVLLMTLQERLEQLDKEIVGVKHQYEINQFELNVLASLRKLTCGSHKQLKILGQVETKVFGKSMDMEPTKQKFPWQKNDQSAGYKYKDA